MKYKAYSVSGILSILSLGGALQGFETSSMAAFLGHEAFLEYFNYPGSLVQGLITGSNPVGAFVGCWMTGFVSDHYGRVRAIQMGSGFWIIGSILSILVRNIVMLIAGRAMKGISIGIFSSLLPVYIAEVIPERKRGLATSTMQWCLTWGIMVMFFLSSFCVYLDDERSFRIAWGVEIIPGVLLFALSFLLPESPKWYASRANWEKAAELMKELKMEVYLYQSPEEIIYYTDEDASRDDSPSNLDTIATVLNNLENNSHKCSYMDLIRADLRPYLMAGIFTQIVTQLSGIGVLMYYLVFICEMIGLTGNLKDLSVSVQYIINCIFTVFPILLMDKLKRKDVLVFGALSLGACIGTLGIIMGVYGHDVPPIGGNESVVWEVTGTPGACCLALCYLFVAIFASTLSCAAWLYTNEIFPARAKSKGSAICMSVSWSFNFLLAFLGPASLQYLKWGTFCIFSGFCITGGVIMSICFPETFRLREAEINNLFPTSKTRDEPSVKESPADIDRPEIRDETETANPPPPQVRRSDSIELTEQTHLPPPSRERNTEPLHRGASTRSFVNDIQRSPHYYNMGTNDSSFLNDYDTDR